uniref:Uncharacterized protein n=1 Tax=Sinocyclocheilus rhinocerous TaxID=307959 RepID=A0A673GAJ0_9TELE
ILLIFLVIYSASLSGSDDFVLFDLREGCEVGDEPADVGVILEGVVALQELGNVANGVALLIGLIYALNLSYLKDLRHTFEFLLKVLELDGHKLTQTSNRN